MPQSRAMQESDAVDQPRRKLRTAGVFLLWLIVTIDIWYFAFLLLGPEARHDREWRDAYAVLPSAEIDGETVLVRNVRNFWWHGPSAPEPAYYDADYDLAALRAVYVLRPLAPPAPGSGSARVFLTFEFDEAVSDDEYAGPRFVSVSVEPRLEQDETYSPFLGFLNQYELMYVAADERDLVMLRAGVYGNEVSLSRIDAPRAVLRSAFVKTMERVNEIQRRPEFYNPLFKNQTTEFTQLFGSRYIGSALSPADVTKRASACAESPDFSLCLRGLEPGQPRASITPSVAR